jgi:hypothetical protein
MAIYSKILLFYLYLSTILSSKIFNFLNILPLERLQILLLMSAEVSEKDKKWLNKEKLN